ncbi:MAG: choline-sulfatase [Gaiellales bacterium]|nr:choline-sulfatase [Gaiellales bacterium]
MTDRQPNILLLQADQLAAAFLPPYGHPVVQAPNIARLAEEGTTFESAYCASPLCSPSRFAMLSGRRPSEIGAYDNAAEFPASLPTVTHMLRAAGYQTALAGKMHFVGPDQLHGYEERFTTDVYPADFEWTPDWRRPPGEPVPWYHNMSSVFEAGVRPSGWATDFDAEVCFTASRRIRELDRRGDDRPFFLTVSFTNPHDPWELPQRHWDLYDDADIDLPAVGLLPSDEVDPHSARLREMYGVDRHEPATDADLRRARHGYYAAISYMDELLGEVLAAIDETGHTDDTVVMFTSDHGEMLGERGLWYKMAFFENACRVPLIVRGPGIRPGRVSSPVSHLDLAPTLLDLCSADSAGAPLEGTSLWPLLAGADSDEAPESVVAEYLAEGVQHPMVMIRRGPHKFIRCDGDPDQLYDLDADARELTNLAGVPAYADLAAQFRRETDERWDLPEVERRILDSQRARHLVSGALATGLYTPWDFQPRIDASREYVRSDASKHPRPWERPTPGALPGAEP